MRGSRSRLYQMTDIRLRRLREEVRSGATEMTGKTYRDASGKVAGRFKGGFSKLYPEVGRSGLTPGQAALAVERGKGKRYRRLFMAAQTEVDRESGPFRKSYRGRLTVDPHPKTRRYCSHCQVMHSKGEHRFHGPGAFHSTHLFSFNPMRKNQARYEVLKYQRQKPRTQVLLETDSRDAAIALAHRIRNTFQGSVNVIDRVDGRGILAYRSFDIGGNPRRWRLRSNPRLTKIYEKVLRIEAQKGPGHKCDAACKRAGHRYFHVFTTKPKMYGLPDGTILIRS
jgi:hypothetical protein